MQLLLLDLFNSHFKRGLFRDVELSRDNYCNRIAVPECFACNGDLIADFHAMYICISVYIIFYYYNITLQIKKEKKGKGLMNYIFALMKDIAPITSVTIRSNGTIVSILASGPEPPPSLD